MRRTFLIVPTVLALACVGAGSGGQSSESARAQDGETGFLAEQLIEAHERTAIASLLAMASNQAAYQTASGGSYGTLECLESPSECIEGFEGPPFSNPYEVEKNGYRRTLHVNADAKMFAYVLVPIRAGETGRRAFCTDGLSRNCFSEDGLPPELAYGACPSLWFELGKEPDEAERHNVAAFKALQADDVEAAIEHLEKYLELVPPEAEGREMAETMLSNLKADQKR